MVKGTQKSGGIKKFFSKITKRGKSSKDRNIESDTVSKDQENEAQLEEKNVIDVPDNAAVSTSLQVPTEPLIVSADVHSLDMEDAPKPEKSKRTLKHKESSKSSSEETKGILRSHSRKSKRSSKHESKEGSREGSQELCTVSTVGAANTKPVSPDRKTKREHSVSRDTTAILSSNALLKPPKSPKKESRSSSRHRHKVSSEQHIDNISTDSAEKPQMSQVSLAAQQKQMFLKDFCTKTETDSWKNNNQMDKSSGSCKQMSSSVVKSSVNDEIISENSGSPLVKRSTKSSEHSPGLKRDNSRGKLPKSTKSNEGISESSVDQSHNVTESSIKQDSKESDRAESASPQNRFASTYRYTSILSGQRDNPAVFNTRQSSVKDTQNKIAKVETLSPKDIVARAKERLISMESKDLKRTLESKKNDIPPKQGRIETEMKSAKNQDKDELEDKRAHKTRHRSKERSLSLDRYNSYDKSKDTLISRPHSKDRSHSRDKQDSPKTRPALERSNSCGKHEKSTKTNESPTPKRRSKDKPSSSDTQNKQDTHNQVTNSSVGVQYPSLSRSKDKKQGTSSASVGVQYPSLSRNKQGKSEQGKVDSDSITRSKARQQDKSKNYKSNPVSAYVDSNDQTDISENSAIVPVIRNHDNRSTSPIAASDASAIDINRPENRVVHYHLTIQNCEGINIHVNGNGNTGPRTVHVANRQEKKIISWVEGDTGGNAVVKESALPRSTDQDLSSMIVERGDADDAISDITADTNFLINADEWGGAWDANNVAQMSDFNEEDMPSFLNTVNNRGIVIDPFSTKKRQLSTSNNQAGDRSQNSKKQKMKSFFKPPWRHDSKQNVKSQLPRATSVDSASKIFGPRHSRRPGQSTNIATTSCATPEQTSARRSCPASHRNVLAQTGSDKNDKQAPQKHDNVSQSQTKPMEAQQIEQCETHVLENVSANIITTSQATTTSVSNERPSVQILSSRAARENISTPHATTSPLVQTNSPAASVLQNTRSIVQATSSTLSQGNIPVETTVTKTNRPIGTASSTAFQPFRPIGAATSTGSQANRPIGTTASTVVVPNRLIGTATSTMPQANITTDVVASTTVQANKPIATATTTVSHANTLTGVVSSTTVQANRPIAAATSTVSQANISPDTATTSSVLQQQQPICQATTSVISPENRPSTSHDNSTPGASAMDASISQAAGQAVMSPENSPVTSPEGDGTNKWPWKSSNEKMETEEPASPKGKRLAKKGKTNGNLFVKNSSKISWKPNKKKPVAVVGPTSRPATPTIPLRNTRDNFGSDNVRVRRNSLSGPVGTVDIMPSTSYGTAYGLDDPLDAGNFDNISVSSNQNIVLGLPRDSPVIPISSFAPINTDTDENDNLDINADVNNGISISSILTSLNNVISTLTSTPSSTSSSHYSYRPITSTTTTSISHQPNRSSLASATTILRPIPSTRTPALSASTGIRSSSSVDFSNRLGFSTSVALSSSGASFNNNSPFARNISSMRLRSLTPSLQSYSTDHLISASSAFQSLVPSSEALPRSSMITPTINTSATGTAGLVRSSLTNPIVTTPANLSSQATVPNANSEQIPTTNTPLPQQVVQNSVTSPATLTQRRLSSSTTRATNASSTVRSSLDTSSSSSEDNTESARAFRPPISSTIPASGNFAEDDGEDDPAPRQFQRFGLASTVHPTLRRRQGQTVSLEAKVAAMRSDLIRVPGVLIVSTRRNRIVVYLSRDRPNIEGVVRFMQARHIPRIEYECEVLPGRQRSQVRTTDHAVRVGAV